MSRKVLVVLGGVVLVLGVFIWQVVANLDSIVAGVVEDVGSDVLKTEVRVSGMAIRLKEGKVGIAGLSVANPEGYSSAKLFDMEGIDVELDLGSLSEDVLVIESILIHNPQISFEADADGGSNMQTLMDNMDSGPDDTDDVAVGEEKKIIINRFEISGGDVNAITPLEPGEVTHIALPGIKMSDIGRRKGGVTPEVAAERITRELVKEIISAATKASIMNAIEKKTKGFLDKLKGDG